MVFHWSLSDCKFPLVSMIPLGIFANLNNAVVWMVSILPLISNSSSLFFLPFGDRYNHSNYNWNYRHLHVPQHFFFGGGVSVKVQIFVSLFAFFYFHSVICWNSNIYDMVGSFFVKTGPCRLAVIR